MTAMLEVQQGLVEGLLKVLTLLNFLRLYTLLVIPTLYTLDIEDTVILLYFLNVESGSLLNCNSLLLQHNPLLLTLKEVLEGLELILLPIDVIF